jgi:hypothetical protein
MHGGKESVATIRTKESNGKMAIIAIFLAGGSGGCDHRKEGINTNAMNPKKPPVIIAKAASFSFPAAFRNKKAPTMPNTRTLRAASPNGL